MSKTLEKLISLRPSILIFLPNTNELQRFVLSGAFDRLARNNTLSYVLPRIDSAKMRAAAPEALTNENTYEIDVPMERFAVWQRLFSAACFRFADRSLSFRQRAKISARNEDLSTLTPPPRTVHPFIRGVSRTLLNIKQLSKALRKRRHELSDLFNQAGNGQEQLRYVDPEKYSDLINRELSTLGPLQDIIELLERVRPLYVILPTSLLDMLCNDVLWACKLEEVACLILQSGWDNLSSKGVVHHAPSHLGCWGPQSVRHAIDIQGMSKHAAHPLGAPHYEFLKRSTDAEVHEFRQQLNFLSSDRLILFGGSFRQFDETSALRQLEAAIEDGRLPGIKILYRPHPWRAERKGEDDFFHYHWKHVIFDPDMRDRYIRARDEPGYLKREVPMYDMSYLALVLSAVDAVISPMSTLLLEAMIMERPTMAIAFSDGKHSRNPSVTAQMTHFAELKDSGALIWCDDIDKLEISCLSLFETKISRRLDKRRKQTLTDIVTREPANYADRLAQLCQKQVEPQAYKLRSRRAGRMRNKISHLYGANLIARNYTGVHLQEPEIPGYWTHGWIPSYHNRDPAFIALHKKEGQHDAYDYAAQIRNDKENVQQWVSRHDQADYLIAHGYKHVRAIGLPIVYLPDEAIERVPGSLLVMPPHGHRTHGEGDLTAESYADAIADLRNRFECVSVCLTETDIRKGDWISAFKRRDINVFNGINQAETNPLQRMAQILSSFEYVTTNGFGSHIAYAAYFGARVSIFGPYANFPIDRLRQTHALRMFPKLLDEAHFLCTEAPLRAFCPELFVDPDRAVDRRSWGADQVGEQCKLSAGSLAEAFNFR